MTNKVVALFLFYLFTFSILGPIDMTILSSNGAEHAGHNDGAGPSMSGHYCEVFKGTCKHGESCPNKHLHKSKKVSSSHSNSNHKHNKHSSDKNNNKDILVIGSSCHSSDDKSSGNVVIDRFLVSYAEAFYNFSTYKYLTPNDGAIYTSHIMDIPQRPPAV